jgi:hypothetical protein
MLEYRLAIAWPPPDYRRRGRAAFRFSREAFAVYLEKITAKPERHPAASTKGGAFQNLPSMRAK